MRVGEESGQSEVLILLATDQTSSLCLFLLVGFLLNRIRKFRTPLYPSYPFFLTTKTSLYLEISTSHNPNHQGEAIGQEVE